MKKILWSFGKFPQIIAQGNVSKHFLFGDHFINSHDLPLDCLLIFSGENWCWSLSGHKGSMQLFPFRKGMQCLKELWGRGTIFQGGRYMDTGKFWKLTPRLIFFRGPFWGANFWRGLWRREIFVSKSIGLTYSWKEIYHFFALFYVVFEGNFQVQVPGGLIFGGAISQKVFCVMSLGGLYLEGLIHGGSYFWNFTVYEKGTC